MPPRSSSPRPHLRGLPALEQILGEPLPSLSLDMRFRGSSHSPPCPQAPATWLCTTPCLAECSPGSCQHGCACWYAGLGAWEREGTGSGEECARLVCITCQHGNRPESHCTAADAQGRGVRERGAGLSWGRAQPPGLRPQDRRWKL